MKIRFENNSIRFRLRRSDMQHLQQHKFISEEILFPTASLHFVLHIQDIPEITPVIAAAGVTILIPVITAEHWITTDEVGLYKLITIGEDKALDIIIEKDFPCKDRPGEDKSDTFSELVQRNNDGKNC